MANADGLEGDERTVQSAEQLGPVVPDEPGQQVGGEEDEPVDVPRPQRLPLPRLVRAAVSVQLRGLYLDHIPSGSPNAVAALDKQKCLFTRLEANSAELTSHGSMSSRAR